MTRTRISIAISKITGCIIFPASATGQPSSGKQLIFGVTNKKFVKN